MSQLSFTLIFISSLSFTLTTSFTAHAESTATVDLPKVQYSGNASFETINEDSYVPPVSNALTGERSTVNDSLKWETAYPLRDNGYPAGALGVNVGGRSSEDTQVTTLGVPLNLPQGGGADFSPFPSFLWDSVAITPTISGAGFAPSASEGRIDFTPWTRAQLLDRKTSALSRATVSYDHDSQTYSLAAKQGQYAAVLGASTGKERGMAGVASAEVLNSAEGHVFLHLIGTDQTGDTPGSLSFPTPGTTERDWRVIPVIESGFKLGGDFEYQTTLFGDLSSLTVFDPTNINNSDTRTQQYGWENALVHGADTLAFSARYVRFAGASYGVLHDWPGYVGYTHEFIVSDEVSVKTTASGTHTDGRGVAPGGKISAKFSSSEKTYAFAELNTVAKLPTLIDRYSNYPSFGFHGNPNLDPERVYAALLGYHLSEDQIEVTSILKAEYRENIQITASDFSTVVNGGDAYLFTYSEDLLAPLFRNLDARAGTYFTYSRLKDKGYSYPDLPFASAVAGLRAHDRDQFSLAANARLVGFSAGPGGKAHVGYTLFDTELTYQFIKGFFAKAGIDNIFGSQGQTVLDYPIEGRRYFAALNATF